MNTSRQQDPDNKSQSWLARVFYSPREHRLRSGWRLLGQLLLLWVLTSLVTIGMGIVMYGAPEVSNQVVLFLGLGISFVAITLSVYIARVYLDRRSFTSLGLRWNRRTGYDLAAGLGISGLMIGLIFVMEWIFGWLTVKGFGDPSRSFIQITGELLYFILIFLIVAWQEELLLRGYWLQNISEGLNEPAGLLLSSALFGLLHLTNPGSSWASTGMLILSGLLFGIAYLRTGSLWLPIGIHIGWNIFEGPVLGFPVSGLQTSVLIQQYPSGPDWITGGSFGPEAGLILLPSLLVGVILIVIYSQNRKNSNIIQS